MMETKGYVLTPEGKKELEDELKWREGEERDRITEAIRVARGFGDLSENSEYDDAKDSQAANEERIVEIKQMLANSSVVSAPKSNRTVDFGHVVTVEDANSRERTFKLVGTAEADPKQGKISNESPMGKALFGHRKGETVSFLSPSGKTLSYKILSIESDKGEN
ncbi:MAG: transcription elongation factor GreA [Coriobacteriales bacterium]|jgi:transcription elongation factor GreA